MYGTVSSNALDFKMRLIIGGFIENMSLLVVLYDKTVSEFGFVNKEQQPWAVKRLKSTSEIAKIESHGSHALSKEREKKFRPWFSLWSIADLLSLNRRDLLVDGH